MSRIDPNVANESSGFPRVSGDEPPPITMRPAGTKFSPRERG